MPTTVEKKTHQTPAMYKAELIQEFFRLNEKGLGHNVGKVEELLPKLMEQIRSDEICIGLEDTVFPGSLLHIVARYSEINFEILFKGSKGITNISVRDGIGVSPIHYACLYGNKNAVETLLKHGANINLGNCNGDTPLMYCWTNGCVSIDWVGLLISFGADINSINNIGQNALHLACKRNDIESAKFLIIQGCRHDVMGFLQLPIDLLSDIEKANILREYIELISLR